MKKLLFLFILGVIGLDIVCGQECDLIFTNTESGTQTHTARNSVTLGPNYTYTPSGGSLTVDIQNPIVNGDVMYTTTPVDPETRTLNTSTNYLPGTTKGSFNVNQMGGASYTIPIEVLPGVNGLSPNLSIVYSSNTGPGLVGYGWQLGGLSLITRGPQTFYSEGIAKGIGLSTSDRFYLDGQKLVTTDSYAYGDANAKYQTDNDIFTRVKPQATDLNGPGWFKAETKSGLIFEYGNSNSSKQKIYGYSQVVNWYVSKISDLFNNQIQFSYLQDNYCIYPAEITYGANTYTFYYKVRYDKNFSFLKGTKIEQDLILDKIIIKYNSTVVKTYEFKYTYQGTLYNGYSTLNEVIEYGIGSSSFNSTAITYQKPDNVSFSMTTNNTINQNINYTSIMVPGDFTGDGVTDLFCFGNPNKGSSWTGERLYECAGIDNFYLTWAGTEWWHTIADLSKLYDVMSLDLNGDGRDDLLFEYFEANLSRFYCMLFDGTSFSIPLTILNQTYGSGTGLFGKRSRQSERQEKDNLLQGSDFNGDGINDILITAPNGDWVIKSFGNSSGQLSSFTLNLLGNGNIPSLATADVFSGDFNGDGIAEIWSFTDSGLTIYSFPGSGSTLTTLYTTTTITKKHFFTLGDFNADGKVDLLLYGYGRGGVETDWTNWQTQISTGAGFMTNTIPFLKSNLKDDYVRIGDFNGDGASDIMASPSDLSWHDVYYFISKNNGSNFYTHIIQDIFTTKNNIYLGDYNGDGITDYLYTDYESPWWTGYKVFKTLGKTSTLIEKIGDGLGFLTKIAYTKMSDPYSNFYERGTGAVFPVSEMQIPLSLVSSIQIDNGKGGMNTLNYYYEGAKTHLQGRGFLGFAKTRSIDLTTGIENQNILGYSTTYYYSKLLQSLTLRTNTSDTIAKVKNIWSENVLDASRKRILPYVQSSIQTNLLTGQKITTTTSGYDNYGNIGTVIKSSLNGPTITTTNTPNNIVSATQWLLGRETPTTIQYVNSDTTITRSVTRSFASNNNHVTQETWFSGTSNQIVKDLGYTPNGSLKWIKSTANGDSRTTTYTYYSDSIRIKTVTDPLLHTVTNTYDSYGRLITKSDYLSNIETTSYDNLHRVSSQSSTFGDGTAISYLWENPLNDPKPAIYSIQKSGIDGSISKDFYDELGRVIRTDVKGFDGTMICTKTIFNIKGQTDSISEPYYSGGSMLWNKYTYDNYGRKVSLTRPSGRNSTWTYTSGSTTVTETTAGRSFTKNFGSDGTMTSATDPGGTISYVYYPDGKVKTITSPGGVTNMKYDIAGNQKMLVDPSAGTIRYTYNGFGELLTQMNNRSQNTQIIYWSDGRIKQKIQVEGTTIYNYNSNKQLTGIRSPGNISHSFQYDSKGRIIAEIDTIPGTTPLTTSCTYGVHGNDSTITHPSGIVEKFYHNGNGYFYRVDANNSAIWTINEKNARQQTISGLLGDNLSTNHTFDDYGYPQSITAGSNNSVQNFSYGFNTVTGNLTWRQSDSNLKETFYYDNLERLDSIKKGTSTLVRTLKMDYNDQIGAISYKSDVGSFHYDSGAKPYQLSSVTPDSSIIPAAFDTLTYTSFEKVNTIQDGNYSASFFYNSGGERVKMEVKQNGSVILTRWYLGSSYIKETSGGMTKEYTFIGGDAYSAHAMAVTQSGTTTYYYLLRDHLGSLTHVVQKSNGVTLYEYSYDAWGRMRTTANWKPYAPGLEPDLFVAGRGFTGHEHLPWVNVINMNGRIYDPLSGQFLSPDNFVQTSDFTQNFNRYGYCFNNPLINADPSGEFIFTLLATFIPGAQFLIPMAMQLDFSWMGGGINSVSNGGSFVQGAVRGGVTGIINVGFSFLNIPGMMPNGFLQAGTSVIGNGISNTIFNEPFLNNWGYNAAIGFASGAYSGYELAKGYGFNPITGGLTQDQLNIWKSSTYPSDLVAAFHPQEYSNAGCPATFYSDLVNKYGETIPVDNKGKALTYGKLSESGNKSIILMNKNISAKRFIMTSYHELTHALMFSNGDIFRRIEFLKLNSIFGSTTEEYWNWISDGTTIFAERWAYGATWSKYGIRNDMINDLDKANNQFWKGLPYETPWK